MGAYRDGVDEQSDNGFRPGDIGGASGDGGAEDDVVDDELLEVDENNGCG